MAQETGVVLPLENVRRDLNKRFGKHGVPNSTIRYFRRHLAQGLPNIAGEPFPCGVKRAGGVHRAFSEAKSAPFRSTYGQSIKIFG